MSLQKLVALADDIPWCGNVPRSRPPRFLPGGIKEPVGPRFALFGPHPEPWDLDGVRSGLADSIRMFQWGQEIKGDIGGAMTAAAQVYFDEQCGSIPLADLLRLILRGPPPPPDPWMERLTYLANTVLLGQNEGPEQLAATAGKQLLAGLKAIQKRA